MAGEAPITRSSTQQSDLMKFERIPTQDGLGHGGSSGDVPAGVAGSGRGRNGSAGQLETGSIFEAGIAAGAASTGGVNNRASSSSNIREAGAAPPGSAVFQGFLDSNGSSIGRAAVMSSWRGSAGGNQVSQG